MSHCYLGCAFFERKNKMKTKKHRLLALALISSFTLMGAVSATVQYPDGGVWTYGESSGGGVGLFQTTIMVKNIIILLL